MALSSSTVPAPASPGTAAAYLYPGIAIQTCHAPGEGIHEPQVLWSHLRSLHVVPGRDNPLPVRVLLADRTLAASPATIVTCKRRDPNLSADTVAPEGLRPIKFSTLGP
jgi:hypothetical protein